MPSRPEGAHVGAHGDAPAKTYYDHSSAQRINTDVVMVAALKEAHPGMRIDITPVQGMDPVDLLAYADGSEKASYEPIIDESDPLTIPLVWRQYYPPALRLAGDNGYLKSIIKYGKFAYSSKGHDYILYVVDGRDGTSSFPQQTNQYLLHGDSVEAQSAADELLRDAGDWNSTLHGEIWVFDQGYWQKNASLYRSIQKSRWEDVILADEEKSGLREDVARFFDGHERYERYRIAWKRGVIYYGPPGNGKTISIKALSHELYERKRPIPTLYVKSLVSYNGPEFSVQLIFDKARAEAPCLLVFEDLDSLITDQVRSYFLNEVDGLNTNQGVYMIGSTNYLERLDPGLSKRPSRFDRKFNFPKPDLDERVMYCEYWRHKLKGSTKESDSEEDDLVHVENDDLEFPKELSVEIAKITGGFSFAYMQEAFVATLLQIASLHDKDAAVTAGSGKYGKKDQFDDLLFWRVIKEQIAVLKDQI